MDTILYRKQGHVAIVTFNRPEVLNAVTRAMWKRMEEVWADVNEDKEVRAVILTGAGERAFSAGPDMKEMASLPPSAPKPKVWEDGDIQVWKPVITAVNGLAMASGFSMVLASDIRIAVEDAVFGMTQVRWGIASGTGTQLLPRSLPYAVALELLLTGRTIDARRAYELGVINKLAPRASLMDTALEVAQLISENAPLAVQHSKESAIRGIGMGVADAMRWGYAMEKLNGMTEDSKEGPKAFVEKRKPVWQSR